MEPNWLQWAKRLQAIAQNGLTYSNNHFDVKRYEEIREIAARMLVEKTDSDLKNVLDLFIREKDYATPKVDVRGAVFNDSKILLIKEASDGLWSLPGGWCDIGESPSESVEREVLEESGLKVKAVKLAAVYDRSKHPHEPPMHYHVYKMFFICKPVGGQLSTGIETTEVGFFPEDGIPELSITKILPFQIAEMFVHYRIPNCPVVFD